MSAEQDKVKAAEEAAKVEFDTSDVDSWIGIPLAGSNMKEPVHVNDIRRWAQGMQNPNPIFYDDEYAAESRFGQIIAPQSFGVCCSDSHGASPAIQGHIEGTHMLFGGDEWWFYGPRILVGDKLRQDRMLFDYRVTQTGFAGPTMFSRGDTTYINQHGEIVCKQRSTSIRYRADQAVERKQFSGERDPEWTDEQLEDLQKQRFDWIQSFRDLGHDRRLFVKVGDKIARRPIGPHTVMSFTTEWRSYLMTVWGTFRGDDSETPPRPFWARSLPARPSLRRSSVRPSRPTSTPPSERFWRSSRRTGSRPPRTSARRWPTRISATASLRPPRWRPVQVRGNASPPGWPLRRSCSQGYRPACSCVRSRPCPSRVSPSVFRRIKLWWASARSTSPAMARSSCTRGRAGP